MAKRNEKMASYQEIKKRKVDNLPIFWEKPYRKAEPNEIYVNCSEVFKFFSSENLNSGLDMSEFVRQSVLLGIGYKKCRKKSVFLSKPFSQRSKVFHCSTVPLGLVQTVCLFTNFRLGCQP